MSDNNEHGGRGDFPKGPVHQEAAAKTAPQPPDGKKVPFPYHSPQHTPEPVPCDKERTVSLNRQKGCRDPSITDVTRRETRRKIDIHRQLSILSRVPWPFKRNGFDAPYGRVQATIRTVGVVVAGCGFKRCPSKSVRRTD